MRLRGAVGAGVAACSWPYSGRVPWPVCPLPQWDQIAHHGDAPTAPSSSHDGAGAAGISNAPIRCSGRPCVEHELVATGHRWAIVRLRDMRPGLALNLVPLCNHVIMASAHRSHRSEGPQRSGAEVESAAAPPARTLRRFALCRKHVSMQRAAMAMGADTQATPGLCAPQGKLRMRPSGS